MFLDGISSVVLTMTIAEPMIRQAGIRDLVWYFHRGRGGNGASHATHRVQPIRVARHDQTQNTQYLKSRLTDGWIDAADGHDLGDLA